LQSMFGGEWNFYLVTTANWPESESIVLNYNGLAGKQISRVTNEDEQWLSLGKLQGGSWILNFLKNIVVKPEIIKLVDLEILQPEI
jgi:hypothetical protein